MKTKFPNDTKPLNLSHHLELQFHELDLLSCSNLFYLPQDVAEAFTLLGWRKYALQKVAAGEKS